MTTFWPTLLVLVLVTGGVAALLFVPFRWQGNVVFPAYRGIDACYNLYLKKRARLDKRKCATNLQIFQQIMTKHQLQFHCSDGTALGLHRDGDLIPWDDDLDVTAHDRDGFLARAWPELQKAGFVHVSTHSQYDMMCLVRDGQKLDVAFYSYEPHVRNSEGNRYWSELQPHVQHIKHVRWQGVDVPIPARDSYYALLYGADWQTPRRNVHSSDALR